MIPKILIVGACIVCAGEFLTLGSGIIAIAIVPHFTGRIGSPFGILGTIADIGLVTAFCGLPVLATGAFLHLRHS